MCVLARVCRVKWVTYESLQSAAGDLFVRQCSEHTHTHTKTVGSSAKFVSWPRPLSVFQTMLQDSWSSDLTSCWSCNHQVTYVKPGLIPAITDTRTAGTSALNNERKTVSKASIPRSEDQKPLLYQNFMQTCVNTLQTGHVVVLNHAYIY